MNQQVPLLNDPREAEVAQRMVHIISHRLDALHQELTSSVLDREQYLLKIGASSELRRVRDELQLEYDRNFRT